MTFITLNDFPPPHTHTHPVDKVHPPVQILDFSLYLLYFKYICVSGNQTQPWKISILMFWLWRVLLEIQQLVFLTVTTKNNLHKNINQPILDQFLMYWKRCFNLCQPCLLCILAQKLKKSSKSYKFQKIFQP